MGDHHSCFQNVPVTPTGHLVPISSLFPTPAATSLSPNPGPACPRCSQEAWVVGPAAVLGHQAAAAQAVACPWSSGGRVPDHHTHVPHMLVCLPSWTGFLPQAVLSLATVDTGLPWGCSWAVAGLGCSGSPPVGVASRLWWHRTELGSVGLGAPLALADHRLPAAPSVQHWPWV